MGTLRHYISKTHIVRLLPSLLLASPIIGLTAAAAFYFTGLEKLYAPALLAATLPVLFTLFVQIVRSLHRGEIGLDVIALLSMAAAVTFGEYLAACVVALMYAGGQFLEKAAEGRANREMTALLSRVPQRVTRRIAGRLEDVPAESIEVGDTLIVRRGDLIPADGVVLEGMAFIDVSALTGEPLPITRNQGETVLSGASNSGDLFAMTATARASDSTYAGIVRLVEVAQRSKAPMSRMADRYALVFLAVTICLASFAWWLSGDAIRAVAVLVIATPCPMILAVPIAWTAGLSRAARTGLLVKGARVLESFCKIRTLVIDKTGTITDGTPTLQTIESSVSEQQLLQLAASLDQASSHVAAKALVDAARRRNIDLLPPSNVSERPGEGISGDVDGRHVAIGGTAYIGDKLGIIINAAERPGAIAAAVAVDRSFWGILYFSDRLRDGIGAVLNGIKAAGITRIILATGDRADVANAIAVDLPFDVVEAELSPADKIEIVNREKRRQPVLMIGDGVNDAPALAAADIGLAMGVHGSAAAAEAADAVLLVERLDRVLQGIEIAYRCRQIALQSILIGSGLSICGMVAAAAGYLTPLQGAILQEAIDVFAILNALRALRIRI
jgi:heavy metal translocating P-type ATPase